ncbi:MAG: DUF1292 domain-containing protein [Lachnospiraceae bacterium]|nr:DUF1292 domain-containing protein [Lachnospiraceae bacterium]
MGEVENKRSGSEEHVEETDLDILARATVAGQEYILAADPGTADDEDREVFVLVRLETEGEGDWYLYRDATDEEADAVGDMLIGIAEEAMDEDEED